LLMIVEMVAILRGGEGNKSTNTSAIGDVIGW
jgi:hypothetical protein